MDLPGNILFSAKGATGFLPPDAHFLRLQAKGFGNLPTILIRDLRAGIHVHASVFSRHRDGTFRFHKKVFHEWREKGVLNDHIRLGESFIQVSFAHFDLLEQVSLLM